MFPLEHVAMRKPQKDSTMLDGRREISQVDREDHMKESENG
jgi:hypothetical protein